MVTAQKSYRLGQRASFYHERGTYGGTIPWVGAHSIDLLRWFAGCEFESVTALHSTVGNRDQGDLEVSAHCQFLLQDGIIGATNIDFLRPTGAPSHGDDRVRIMGTDGQIEIINETPVLIDSDGERELPQAEAPTMLEAFAEQCTGGSACPVSAEDSIAMTRACLLARRSADSNGDLMYFNDS